MTRDANEIAHTNCTHVHNFLFHRFNSIKLLQKPKYTYSQNWPLFPTISHIHIVHLSDWPALYLFDGYISYHGEGDGETDRQRGHQRGGQETCPANKNVAYYKNKQEESQ